MTHNTPEYRRAYAEEHARQSVWEALCEVERDSGMQRHEIAKVLGTSRANVTQLFRGGNYTIRQLARLAFAMGFRVRITFHRGQEPAPCWACGDKPSRDRMPFEAACPECDGTRFVTEEVR